MVRTFVDSSDLRSVGYANTVLEIEFNSGGIYQYFDVPYQVYIALISAPSHGENTSTNISRTIMRIEKLLNRKQAKL